MKIKIIIVAIIFFVISNANALDMIITEAYFNPINTEAGGEAIELYNPTNQYINISNYVIATESSPIDAVLPNILIEPYSFYLIADAGWSTNKDNLTWPDADHEEILTMANTNSGIALIYNGTVLDAVGWGDPSSIEAGLYEGTPHPNIVEGFSLRRKIINRSFSDTNNNSYDFYFANPDLRNSSYSLSFSNISYSEISVRVLVSQPSVNISVLILPDDLNSDGFQIIPAPGKNKNIMIRVEVNDSSGNASLVYANTSFGNFVLNKIEDNDTEIFEGNFNIEYFRDPGVYSVNITVIDSLNRKHNTTILFEYLSLVAFEINSEEIYFDLSPGMNLSRNISLKNIGNIELDSEVYGTDLTSSENTIPVENIFYSVPFDGYDLTDYLTNVPKLIDMNLTAALNSKKDIYFSINIPVDTVSGMYTGSISIIATES